MKHCKLRVALISLLSSIFALFSPSLPSIDVNIFLNSNGNSIVETQPSSSLSQSFKK
jgi:hypothetical protein